MRITRLFIKRVVPEEYRYLELPDSHLKMGLRDYPREWLAQLLQ
jgi:hypothetical protein